MRDLRLYELGCVSAAGETPRIIGSLALGILNGMLSSEGFQGSDSAQEHCMKMILNAAKGAVGALLVSQIISYENDYSSIYYENYMNRERILVV
tara:strand:+ start:61678 stop:61959 length:282 start_codon:yes stop_codon:yes gene_type:complete